jgi:hypothetical protein
MKQQQQQQLNLGFGRKNMAYITVECLKTHTSKLAGDHQPTGRQSPTAAGCRGSSSSSVGLVLGSSQDSVTWMCQHTSSHSTLVDIEKPVK